MFQNKIFYLPYHDVLCLQTRHQQGDNYTLTVDEILDETNQADVPVRQKHWLVTEVRNPGDYCTNS